jgi:hypothetical protein
MNLEQLLKKVNIDKVVDSGGSNPGNSSSLPPEIAKQIEITPISNLASDLSNLIITTNQKADTLISNISTTIKDPIFLTYLQAVKANYFDPAILITNPTSTPVKLYTDTQIKTLERDIYMRSLNPQAPFIQDIYRVKSDLGTSQYLINTVWNQVTSTAPVVKLGLFQEAQHVNLLSSALDDIKNNLFQPMAPGFVNEFASYISLNKNLASFQQTIEFAKSLLQISLVHHVSDWENFHSNIQDYFKNFIGYTAQKAMLSQVYRLIGDPVNNVLTFVSEFENLIPANSNLFNHVREFRSNIENALYKNMGKIEEDLVFKETLDTKLRHDRQLAISNSQQKVEIQQQYMLLDSAAKFLASSQTTSFQDSVGAFDNLDQSTVFPYSKEIFDFASSI